MRSLGKSEAMSSMVSESALEVTSSSSINVRAELSLMLDTKRKKFAKKGFFSKVSLSGTLDDHTCRATGFHTLVFILDLTMAEDPPLDFIITSLMVDIGSAKLRSSALAPRKSCV